MMKYIDMDDIRTLIQNEMIMSSVEKESELIDSIESMVISEVEAYIGGRYDTGKLFADPPLRTGLLVRAIACIVTCRAVRRNAARKVPDSFYEMENWAFDILEKIRDGKMTLPKDVPTAQGENGKPVAPLIYGHNRNNGWHL